MFQTAPADPDSTDIAKVISGAEDQAAAYAAWLTQWATVDPEDEEHEWQIVSRGLQETRRELGQRLLFPE